LLTIAGLGCGVDQESPTRHTSGELWAGILVAAFLGMVFNDHPWDVRGRPLSFGGASYVD